MLPPAQINSASARAKTPRDPVISWLKGMGMVFIILIHLLDWSNIAWGREGWGQGIKEIFYAGPLIFIALAGTVVAIAYAKKPLWMATRRLWSRGVQLILVYWTYNIFKLFIFDFRTEPFYARLIQQPFWGGAAGTQPRLLRSLDEGVGNFSQVEWGYVWDVLTFHTLTVPITIIPTIGAFLLISPIFLWLAKQSELSLCHSREGGNPVPNADSGSTTSSGLAMESSRIKSGMTKKQVLLMILTILFILPVYLYGPGLFTNPILKFLVSDGYVLYPLLLWLPTFLIGFLWGKLGWQVVAWEALGIFAVLTASSLFIDPPLSFTLSANEFPIQPYYLWASFLTLAVFAQAFIWLTRLENTLMQKTITFLAWLGDKSFLVYVGHWIVIDATIWLFAPQWKVIWMTVPLAILLTYLWESRNNTATA